jgi:two-component system sensor histidine kinase/response regulator
VNNATILIVDDNPDNLRVLFDYLAELGYRVLVAEDGESALTQVPAASPDLILMDVLLPGISGFETCRALKEDQTIRDIPVIFLTALSTSDDKVEGFRAGGVDYLTKPLQLEEVAARIGTHLTILKLRRELEEQNRLLTEANMRKDRLFTIIAHDLRSPIAMFVSAMRVLGNLSPDDKEYQEIVDGLSERADRLDRLLNNLLDWAGLQITSDELAPDRFLLSTAVGGVLEIIGHEATDKEIEIVVQVPDDLIVHLNLQAVRRVLSNLLSNAVKFSEPGKSVTLAAAKDGDEVVVTVKDTGVGMTEEEIDLLFRLDKRIHKVGTRGEKGSGLGLVISHELISRLGGTITVESKPGEGTEVRVALPDQPIAD